MFTKSPDCKSRDRVYFPATIVKVDFQFIFDRDRAAAGFYGLDAVVRVQERHLSLRPQMIASHMQGERETDGLFDSVKFQVSGNGQGPDVPSLLHRRNADGTEYDLGIFCYVEHLLAAEPP